MASPSYILDQIVEGEKDPYRVDKDKWRKLRDYVQDLEEKALQMDNDRPVHGEPPVAYSFDGVEEEMQNTEEIVETVMRHDEKTINDFQRLEWFIKTKIQNLDLNLFDHYTKGIKASTIQRARRTVFEEHPELDPSTEVQEGRREKAEEMKQYHSKR